MAIADSLSSLPFIFPLALLGLLSIIPLIILYMLLPKPFKVSMPSVMFLMRVEESREKIYSSITKIVRDPLFIVQLFVLIMLAVAAAGPYILSYDTLSDKNTVIIIDGSASMQIGDRFAEAQRDAPRYLSQVNTVILAESTPVIIAENVSAADAERAIKGLSSKAVTADIGSSMATASSILSAKGGSVYVLSDFTAWDGLNPMEAKNLLGSGLDVTFVPYGTPTSNNLAIINGYLEKSNGTYNYYFMVRNYDTGVKSVYANVTTTLPNGSKLVYSPLTVSVQGDSVETFVFKNVRSGTTEIKLITSDAIESDNYAYISIPGTQSADVLYISDAGGTLPSEVALSLIPELTVTSIEEVPESLSMSYSFVVVNMGDHVLTSEEVDTLHTYVSNGGNLVFVAGKYLEAANQTVNLSKMLPARINSTVSSIDGTQIYAVGSDFTSDLDLNSVYMRTYLNAETRDLSATAYPVMTMEGVPIIAYGPYNNGTVFYFGLNDHSGEDAWNNFASFPAFPVFWIRIADYFAGIGDISEYNVKAGTIMTLSADTEILTPNGKTTTNRVLFDTVGVYTIGSKKIAVNMYNDKESNTVTERMTGLENANEGGELPTQYEIKTNIFYIFAILAALLMILELYLLRKRGDI
ncbi:BatA domain-containing protein [Methanimicrococcus blatticola]|uniref:Putative membrane protein (TIGR02226 family) n=1 Tax=Methanimicrococcus blatticola TaxID=91560 RepID=A0A484F7N0_9EURY|nr:BatA domain-containing protein [Methanimicrococcus blatticola]MBZ3935055.1 BatA domain-containing protein [Methanimicrococcus blatticola]MCC2508848.1 BatA domain-containing protein [Methanimicrococcus blatticola]TDQ71125.1 putative membrane protein (TIGR02226 family) [Methanimicrococcus blatticola]